MPNDRDLTSDNQNPDFAHAGGNRGGLRLYNAQLVTSTPGNVVDTEGGTKFTASGTPPLKGAEAIQKVQEALGAQLASLMQAIKSSHGKGGPKVANAKAALDEAAQEFIASLGPLDPSAMAAIEEAVDEVTDAAEDSARNDLALGQALKHVAKKSVRRLILKV